MIGAIEIPDDFLVWLLRTTLQVSFLIGLIVGVQWLFQNRLPPRWRFALWWLVVLRLMMPVSIESPVSLFNLLPIQLIQPSPNPSTTSATPLETAPSRESPPYEASHSPLQEHAFGPAETGIHSPPQEESKPLWETIAFYGWLSGAAILLTALIGLALSQHRRIRLLPRITGPWITGLLTECQQCMRVHRTLDLRQTYEARSPTLYGLFRPVLLLPKELRTRLGADQLRHVFFHELAHLKRGDIAFNWLTVILLALHWFNPLLWWALRRMRADAEIASDALALSFLGENENQAYGQTVLELTDGPRSSAPLPGLVGISANHQSIKRRIEMIAMTNTNQRKQWPYLAAAITAVLAVTALTNGVSAESGPTDRGARHTTDYRSLAPSQLERTVEILDQQLEIYNRRITELEDRLDNIRSTTDVTSGTGSGQSIQAFEIKKLEAGNELTKWMTLYETLQSTDDVIYAIQASPLEDETLNDLQKRRYDLERKRAELHQDFSPEHPNVKTLETLMDTIDQQINSRVNGLMNGLKARVESTKQEYEELQGALKARRDRETQSEEPRLYNRLKDRLKNIKQMRDSIHMQLMEAQLELELRRGLDSASEGDDTNPDGKESDKE